MIVVADSGPLRYLIIVEQIHLLPALYGHIIIPPGVVNELTHASTPEDVRSWVVELPTWSTIKTPQNPLSELAPTLGRGEREAIALVEELAADVMLVDDEAARREAERRNINVQGTLATLDLAAEHGLLVDLPLVFEKLKGTNFRASKRLFDFFLKRDIQRKIQRN